MRLRAVALAAALACAIPAAVEAWPETTFQFRTPRKRGVAKTHKAKPRKVKQRKSR